MKYEKKLDKSHFDPGASVVYIKKEDFLEIKNALLGLY